MLPYSSESSPTVVCKKKQDTICPAARHSFVARFLGGGVKPFDPLPSRQSGQPRQMLRNNPYRAVRREVEPAGNSI